jgi:predicted Rossmann fold flavoprotein
MYAIVKKVVMPPMTSPLSVGGWWVVCGRWWSAVRRSGALSCISGILNSELLPANSQLPTPNSQLAIVVGAGAAGLATAIFAKRAAPDLDVRCLDGATKIGAKILVSGGSRCNVTNRVVTERDFWGGSSRIVRNVLRAFPADRAAAFFESLGVRLHEEEDGKLFPDTNRSRTVLDALLAEADHLGVAIDTGRRVTAIVRASQGLGVETADGSRLDAQSVALATGGRSLPKTGSDGFGYELARTLGHAYVETTPALAPLVLDGDRHAALAGVTHDVALSLRTSGSIATRIEGSMLWTHFGISGPAALNMSRHWHRARLAGEQADVRLNVCPGETFESLEEWWLTQDRLRPRAQVRTVLATRLPASVADAWIAIGEIEQDTTLAHLSKIDRRKLTHALLDTPLAVVDSRGYSYAEVTAGGVPLDEIDPATMESRVCPKLFLVGEILDVDGRLGGFNFQWAWSSGWVAGHAMAKASRA